MIMNRLRKKLTTGLVSLLSLVSCAPSSEIERTVEAVRNIENQPVPGVFIPNYPPYVPEEDPEPGNSKYPKQIIEYDDVSGADELVDQKCRDNGYASISRYRNIDAVINGIILEFDHSIESSQNDFHVGLAGFGQGHSIDFGFYLVIRKEIYFKEEKEETFNGWDKYAFFLIDRVKDYMPSGGMAVVFNARDAVNEAYRKTPLIGILNFDPNNDLNIVCVTDLNGE